MTPRNLIRRLLDGDLSAEERATLEAAAARDPALASELAAHRAIVEAATRLDRPSPPEGLDDRIVARLGALPVPRRTLIARVAALPWGRAAAAAAAIAAVAGGALALGYRAGVARGRADVPPAAAAVGAGSEVVVRFSLVAPEARRVELAGDFNGWRPEAAPLTRAGGTAWVTTVRVAPGRHEYTFVIDGRRWVPDPAAAEIVDDGFGGKNAVLDVL